MPPFRLVTAALAGWILLAGPAATSADIFVSPFLGLKFRGATNNLDFDTGAAARDTKMSVGISGVVIADAGPGIELELAHQPRFFEQQTGTIVTRSGVTTLSANALVALPLSVTRDSLRPYGVLGVGWMHASLDNTIGFEEFNNDFLALSIGAGAIGFLTDVVGLRFDARFIRSVSSTDRSVIDGDLARLRFWRATLGVVFR